MEEAAMAVVAALLFLGLAGGLAWIVRRYFP